MQNLNSAAASNDPKAFDKHFKDFRRKYKINRGSRKERRTKLTPVFVRDLLSIVFTPAAADGGIKMQIFPEETVRFLLECQVFSRDAVPGAGEDKLVQAAWSHWGFMKMLLESEPCPFGFRDFLLLMKKFLESPLVEKHRGLGGDGGGGVTLEMVFEAFERNVDLFFDGGDMKSVLSTDNLLSLLSLLTSSSTPVDNASTPPSPDSTLPVPYSALLTSLLDSIGLSQLFLPTTLLTPLLDSLLASLTTESAHLSSCLSTSSILSLALKRQHDSLGNHPAGNTKKRKRSAGQLEIVAEEGGRWRRRGMWIKRDEKPAQGGKGITKRFVATAKFLEVPSYSLDRMVL